MITFRFDIPEELRVKEDDYIDIKVFSEHLWKVYRNDGVKQELIFKNESEFYVSTEGDIVKGDWIFARKNNTVVLSTKDDLTRYYLKYLDKDLVVLQKAGTDSNLILINENASLSFQTKNLDELVSYVSSKMSLMNDSKTESNGVNVGFVSQSGLHEKAPSDSQNDSMEPLSDSKQRVEVLCESMVSVGKQIEDAINWFSINQSKAIDGNSMADWMTGALFGGGLIGMAISKKIRTGKKSTKSLYKGMTADEIGEDIVNQVRKMVNYQCEIQRLVSKDDEGNYYNLVDFIFQCAYKYHMAWMYFTSFYCTNHKVEYNGVKMTLEDSIRKRWFKEMLRMDMKDETRMAIEKACK